LKKTSYIDNEWNVVPLKDATMMIVSEHNKKGELIKQEIFEFTD